MNIKIRDNIHQVGGNGLTYRADAAAYLVRFGDKAALIDAGSGYEHERLSKNIAECLEPGVQLEYLLLTHCHFDHTGGAKAVREEFGCRIVAHELDAVYLEAGDNRVTVADRFGAILEPLPVDIKLSGKETILQIGTGSIKAIHSPGHSPGSVVYTTEIDGLLILFGQDVHGPIHSEWLSDEKQYINSLLNLLRLNADILLEGHFGVVETKPEVQEFIEYWISPLGLSHYAVLYTPEYSTRSQRTAYSAEKLSETEK